MSNDGTSTAGELIDITRPYSYKGNLGKPVDLNIKKFKRHLKDNYPGLTKFEFNYLVKRYKQEAWSDYDTIVKMKLAEPTRTKTKKEEDGQQSEQATNIPLASK